MSMIILDESDHAKFKEAQEKLYENKLQPLSSPSSWDSIVKGLIPLGIILLVGIGLLDQSALPQSGTFGWVANGNNIRYGVIFVSFIFLVSMTLSSFGRYYLARDAIAVWKSKNTAIFAKVYEWFLETGADDIMLIAPALDEASGLNKKDQHQLLNNETSREIVNRMEFVMENCKSAVDAFSRSNNQDVYTRYETLAKLITSPCVLEKYLPEFGDKFDGFSREYLACGRLIRRLSHVNDFREFALRHLHRQKRAFVLSFLSVDLFLVPLALLALTLAVLRTW